MPPWISQLALLPLVLMIYILLFAANVLVTMFKAGSVKRLYQRDGSRAKAMQRLRSINRFGNGASWAVMWYTMVVFILPAIGLVSRLTAVVAALVLPFIGAVLLLTIEHFALYDLTGRIRGTTETGREGLLRKLRMFMFAAITHAIFWLPIIALSHPWVPVQPRYMPIGAYVYAIVFGTLYLLLMSWIASRFFPLALGARRVGDDHVYGKLFAVTRKAGLNGIKLYIWPGIKNKEANAMFSGTSNKKIFISDYLLEQLSDEEIEYVMGHEIGHDQKGHLRTYSLLVLLYVVSVILVNAAVSFVAPGISLAVRFLIIIGVALLYLQVVVNDIRRMQEREADAYALQLGARPLAGISALFKLARLNNSPVHLHNVAEKLQTHPSIANRIKSITPRLKAGA